jgi:Arm DNA-binding domain/Phage integrase, N-terminal SAM-like domain
LSILRAFVWSTCERIANRGTATAGHFRRRGSRWYFWIELEPDVNGERRQRSVAGFRTRREAEDAHAEIRAGEYLEPCRTTLGAYLTEQWLPSTQMSVRPTTHDHYRKNMEGYVLDVLGRRRLIDLAPLYLNAFYSELLRSGRRNVKPGTSSGLSPSTVHHVHSTLHKALNGAVRWGLISRNPDPVKKSLTSPL